MYEGGQGTAKDLDASTRYYKLSADNGSAEGLCRLGQMYLAGERVTKDREKALQLFKMSADKGNVFARQELDKIIRRPLLN